MSQTAVLDAYRAQLDTLATGTDRTAQAILAALLADRTTEAAAVLALASEINKANSKATSLADYYLAQQITAVTGRPTPTVGLVAEDGSARLVKAAHTTFQLTRDAISQAETTGKAERPSSGPAEATTAVPSPDADPTDRLTRLARSEPLETAQRATTEAMGQQPHVEGWVRELHEGACELCVWWWRNGRVWPKEHPMPTHKGCLCSQRVVVQTSIQSTGYTRRLARNGR